jgi:The GLUG motif
MLEKLNCYAARVSIFLITAALIAGMVGCAHSSQNLEIRTWYDLDAVRHNLGGHHILMNDLNSTTDGYEELASPSANEGQGWQPIIGSGGNHPPFTGTFDGQGYEIRDLFINLPGKGYVGLFSILSEGGVVQNIGVVDANVTSTAYIGSLVGVNLGTVNNSYSTGSVTGNFSVGGLVGSNGDTVSNSYSTCNVNSDYGAGGLTGGNVGTVSNSYSTGSVTSQEGVGGLVAANNGTVSNCYSTGSVTGNSSVGGLVAANNGTVSNCYSTGNVTGNTYVGGLVGGNTGTVSNSFWDTETSGQSTSAGGIGKTTAQMKDITTFSGAGWNITAVVNQGTRNPSYIWNIVTGQIYPFLSWQS